ncbi:MAG: hypothetical protein AAF353_00525 [Pseudomonadota bacterium]
MRNLLFVMLLLISASVQADGQWYDCSVNEFYVLAEDGNLKSKQAGYEGQTFRVDRKAGVIVGDKINTLYNVDVVASNPGDPGIFSLVNYSRKENGEIRRLSTLTVQDYGNIKPFVLSEGNYIFTGICR